MITTKVVYKINNLWYDSLSLYDEREDKMMSIDWISVGISLLGSSVVTLVLSTFFFQPMQDRRKYIFDEKKIVYESIIVFAQIVLFPVEAKFSLSVARYNIQELPDNENINNAINDLKMTIPKVKLISKDDGLVDEIEKFIQLKNEEQFNVLIKRLRRDLYR